MKCETCLNFLEEYVDGELAREDVEKVESHLLTCAECKSEFAMLSTEQELFAQYDRELEVPPSLWTSVAAEIIPAGYGVKPEVSPSWFTRLATLFQIPSVSFAGAVAVLLLALIVGAVYLFMKQSGPTNFTADNLPVKVSSPEVDPGGIVQPPKKDDESAGTERDQSKSPKHAPVRTAPVVRRSPIDQSDVIAGDLGPDLEEQDTFKHLEQTQNLLLSIRNVTTSDSDDDVDVSYDKALSRRLLNENIVLRRDAEMKGKYPTKEVLTDLEPLLLDIANLPDKAKPEQVREIKERVEKTEIVAALLDYQGRAIENR